MSTVFDYDSPWKEGLRLYLRSFIRLCFPEIEKVINWSRQPEFLDKELQQITRDADSGKQYVDMLVQVWLLNGCEEWLLLHIEVQHRPETGFEARLFRYYYRILDVYGRPVTTLAILADSDPNWRPSHHEIITPGTRLRFDFSVCKLVDLLAQGARVTESHEPAAIIVLANWAAQQAAKDDERRLSLKWDLTRRLYETGLQKADILELYRLVDWLLKLPKELEAKFLRKVYEFEQEKIMPYVTNAERFGIEKGIQQGIEKGIQQGIEKGIQQGIEKGIQEGIEKGQRMSILEVLEARFGKIPDPVRERIMAETDVIRLKTWLRQAGTCARVEDFKTS